MIGIFKFDFIQPSHIIFQFIGFYNDDNNKYLLCSNLKRPVIVQACCRIYWEVDCEKGAINFFISHF